MPIEFIRQRSGFYRAEIDGVEVKVCNVGYEISLDREEVVTECDHDGCKGDYDQMDECVRGP